MTFSAQEYRWLLEAINKAAENIICHAIPIGFIALKVN